MVLFPVGPGSNLSGKLFYYFRSLSSLLIFFFFMFLDLLTCPGLHRTWFRDSVVLYGPMLGVD